MVGGLLSCKEDMHFLHEVAGYTISCLCSSEYMKSQISCIDLMNMPFPVLSIFMMFLLLNKCQIFDFMETVEYQASSKIRNTHCFIKGFSKLIKKIVHGSPLVGPFLGVVYEAHPLGLKLECGTLVLMCPTSCNRFLDWDHGRSRCPAVAP
jgi:hypothetical protein